MKKLFRFCLFIFFLTFIVSCQSRQIETRGGFDANTELSSDGKVKTVALFAINDLHGSVEEEIDGKNPGIAKLYQALVELRQAYPASLFVSAGDNYQGSALSNLTQGKIVSDFFALAGLDASAVGNHEFDWTDERFADWQKDGGFPFIAANIIDKRTGDIPSWAEPYVMYRVGGRLIALIGLSTPNTPNSTKAEFVENYVFTDPAEAALKYTRQLQATYKPDAIIALTHIGSFTNRLNTNQAVSIVDTEGLEKLSKVKGLDAIISGHSHMLVSAKSAGVPVVQAMNYGRGISKVVISFNSDGSKRVSVGVEEIYKNKNDIPEHPQAMSIVQQYNNELGGELGERLAVVEGDLNHETDIQNVTPMGYWVCEMLRTHFDADVAVMNGGGLRKGFLPGPVSVKDMWELMPFDNTAVLVELKGLDLKQVIDHGIDSNGFRPGQFAGLTVNYKPQAPRGQRIVSMFLADGTEVQDNGVYTMVTNDFLFDGGDLYTMVKPAAVSSENTYVPIRELLIEDTRKAGSIIAEPFTGLLYAP
ncbi:MAG: hypothetical protein GX241_06540 [Ruminococcaceae bacterium]|nr:hypothetical protein [Oscillospiraceae bacterium]